MSLRRRLAWSLAQAAAARLRRRRPEWADALLSEQAHLPDADGGLAWSLGALRAAANMEEAYPTSLALAVAAMALYQWSADESLATLAMMTALCLLLGGLRPSMFLLSGLAVGTVVAAVNGFETLTGVRPAYELHPHTWVHDLRWLLLAPPAILGSALGRWARARLPDPL